MHKRNIRKAIKFVFRKEYCIKIKCKNNGLLCVIVYTIPWKTFGIGFKYYSKKENGNFVWKDILIGWHIWTKEEIEEEKTLDSMYMRVLLENELNSLQETMQLYKRYDYKIPSEYEQKAKEITEKIADYEKMYAAQ